MRQKTDKLPEKTDNIIDNLENFVEQLFKQIAEGSINGDDPFIKAMTEAKKAYQGPSESWIYGWAYVLTRGRGAEIDTAIASLKGFSASELRLQELKVILDKGGQFPDSSYNYYLLEKLVQSIPGYKPLTPKIKEDIITRIGEIIRDKIDYKIDEASRQDKANEEAKKQQAAEEAIDRMLERNKEARNNELLQIHKTKKEAIMFDNVLLFNNVEEARKSAIENLRKIHFALVFTENHWNISWVDLNGKAHEFELEFNFIKTGPEVTKNELVITKKELLALLENKAISDVTKVKGEVKQQIIRECFKERQGLLKEGPFQRKVSLQVNPVKVATHEPKSNSDLVFEEANPTFVLRGTPQNYSLTWINYVGNAQIIPLDNYPKLQQWLNLQTQLQAEQLDELKVYLYEVDTRMAMLGKDTIKLELDECFTHGPQKPSIDSIKKANTPTQEPSVDSIKEASTPKQLDLSKFKDVTSFLNGRNTQSQGSAASSVSKKTPIKSTVTTTPTVSEEVEPSVVVSPPSKKTYLDAVRMFGPKPNESEEKQQGNELSGTYQIL